MSTASDPTREVLLSRLPVFDVDRKIHGFELLYRAACPENAAEAEHSATAAVMLNALLAVGVDSLGCGELLFFNCSRDDLFSSPVVPSEKTVLEVPAAVGLDDALVQRLHELRQAGYRIALDNVLFSEDAKKAIAEADYVKLDLRRLSAAQLADNINALKQLHVRIIATKVESEAELQQCHRLGIDLFQGCFLRKPDVVCHKSIPTSRFAAMQLVAECEKPNVTLQQVAAIISRDVALAWGLLRLANTILYTGSAPVETITQAVGRLGTHKVMRWALLLAIAGQESCPNGYLQLSLQRAFMCERIACDQQVETPEKAFLVGLLSLLDSIVDVPMPVLVRQLPVSASIRNALLDREGPEGRILHAVLAWERADWPTFNQTEISAATAREAWLYSMGRSSEAFKSLHEANSKPEVISA